jgi:drug/metabolite transporter (DMT)-like permease
VHVALPSIAAVVALGVGGSAIGLLLYFYIMNKLGPVQATGVTLLVPVTAVFWGVVLLNEALTLPIVVGMVVILTGIVLTNVRARKPKQVSEKEPAAA